MDEQHEPAPRPLLELAARSIAQVSGVAETVIDVLHGKAFRHYAEGLRQYVAIRLADPRKAPEILRELRAIAAAKGAGELVKPPGVRAQLYMLARQLADHRERTMGRSATKLPWRAPLDPARAQAVEDIRGVCSPEEAELVELRYARELNFDEIAFVTAREMATVESMIAEAVRRAQPIVARHSDWLVADALLEAYALDPAPVEEEETELSALPAGTIIGSRYSVQARVGSGSFADVYRAADTEVPGHVVAVKLLHQPSLSDAAKEAALRELRLIASVFHPSIVQFKDHGWHESRLWFVMPWYEGETLESRIDREPLTRAEARRIFEHLAHALGAMHAAGVRHQDVKPDNIFLANLRHYGLDEEGGVLPVLLDLGVAAKEAEMVVAGTPTYFAPEVAAQFANVPKKHEIGSKSDIFSLALSLRNSLEPETQDDVPAGAVERFIEHRATERPHLFTKTELKYLGPHFHRWLSLDPRERPTADDFAKQLDVLTRPEDRRRRRRAILRWLGPLLVALGVIFASVVFVIGKQSRLNELEAAQARLEAEATRAELDEESELRRALEEDVADIRERYASSQFTRQELAERLASTESRLGISQRGLAAEQRRGRTLQSRLTEATTENQRLGGELDTTRLALGDTQRNLAQTQTELATERSRATELDRQLREARADEAEARLQVAELGTQVRALEAQVATARAESRTLAAQAAQAETARAQAEQQLAQAQARIAQLERQLARRGPVPPPEPGPGPDPDPGGSPTVMAIPVPP
jgi:hypothetical protein